MSGNDEVSVCLTSEEYNKLVKDKQEYFKAKQTIEKKLSQFGIQCQKKIDEAAERLQNIKKTKNQLQLEISQCKKIKQKLLDENTSVNTEAHVIKSKLLEGQKNTVKATQVLQKLEKDVKQAKSYNSNLSQDLVQINQRIKSKQPEIVALKERLQTIKCNQETQETQDVKKQIQRQQLIRKSLQESKEELETNLKITQLRMQNKQQFVCSYYQSMRQKLSDFDKSEIRDIINNDIDDFVRYLTLRKDGKNLSKQLK